MDEPKVITISQAQYLELLAAQELLDALQACGVDNWQGWDNALKMCYGDEDETEEDIYGEKSN